MKTLIAAAGVVLLANAFALTHAAKNRSGIPEAELLLTERELSFYNYDRDNSGVTLNLQYNSHRQDPDWLDSAKLQTLGFDVSVAPALSHAEEFYRRQLPRPAFIALEFDGPAFRNLPPKRYGVGRDILKDTRLVAIDASTNASALRARHPDRRSIVILPAMLGIDFAKAFGQGPARISGYISAMPTSIHIPRPFSDGFRNKPKHYRVRVNYGRKLEPWVVGVEFD